MSEKTEGRLVETFERSAKKRKKVAEDAYDMMSMCHNYRKRSDQISQIFAIFRRYGVDCRVEFWSELKVFIQLKYEGRVMRQEYTSREVDIINNADSLFYRIKDQFTRFCINLEDRGLLDEDIKRARILIYDICGE